MDKHVFKGDEFRNIVADFYRFYVSNIDPDKYYVWHDPTERKSKRSLEANNYSWLLTDQIANVLTASGAPVSKLSVHEKAIFDYGQPLLDENGNATLIRAKKKVDLKSFLRAEGLYALPVKQFVENGEYIVEWKIYRGSHDYNTREMSIFINGIVSDAKDLGIDTTPPAELELLEDNHKSIMPPVIDMNVIPPDVYSNGWIKGWHKHHIYTGANRNHSELYGCFCWLRPDYHNMSNKGVHADAELQRKLQSICQRAWMDTYNKTEEDFMKIFGKSYI